MIAHLIRNLRIRVLEHRIAMSVNNVSAIRNTHYVYDFTQRYLILRELVLQAKLTSRRDRLARAV